VAPYLFIDLESGPDPIQFVEITGTWDIEGFGVSSEIDTTKIICRRDTGYCFESRAFPVNKQLVLDHNTSQINIWNSHYIIAQSILGDTCLYANRKEKSAAYYATDESGCTKVPVNSKLNYLRDRDKAKYMKK